MRRSSLPELSLEELMGMDAGRVFGASERLQPVTEAPASVSFITAEEIARTATGRSPTSCAACAACM